MGFDSPRLHQTVLIKKMQVKNPHLCADFLRYPITILEYTRTNKYYFQK